MFGYVDINKQGLAEGQQGLWQTFMCGLCFSTKKLFGNLPRAFITNDINFFNVLFHSIANVDVEIEHSRCFSHPFAKRTVLKQTALTDKLSVANVLLTYLNLYDDVLDDGGAKKKLALSVFAKPYKKAQAWWPELDKTLCKHYQDLRTLEQSNCQSLDRVAHSFASLSQDFCTMCFDGKISHHATTLCYNIGKWIYLVDALDDIAKDLKKGNYNPIVACYNLQKVGDVVPYLQELQFEMFAVLNRIAQCFNDLNLTKYNCILKNVLFDSIRGKTTQVLAKYQQQED